MHGLEVGSLPRALEVQILDRVVHVEEFVDHVRCS